MIVDVRKQQRIDEISKFAGPRSNAGQFEATLELALSTPALRSNFINQANHSSTLSFIDMVST